MASITVNEMRLILRDAYPGKGWKYRVMHMMKDNQVIAIYQSYINRKHANKEKEKKDGYWKQMSFNDYLEEKNGKLDNCAV